MSTTVHDQTAKHVLRVFQILDEVMLVSKQQFDLSNELTPPKHCTPTKPAYWYWHEDLIEECLPALQKAMAKLNREQMVSNEAKQIAFEQSCQATPNKELETLRRRFNKAQQEMDKDGPWWNKTDELDVSEEMDNCHMTLRHVIMDLTDAIERQKEASKPVKKAKKTGSKRSRDEIMADPFADFWGEPSYVSPDIRTFGPTSHVAKKFAI